MQPGDNEAQDNHPRRRRQRNVGQRPQHNEQEQRYRLRATNARQRDFMYTN